MALHQLPVHLVQRTLACPTPLHPTPPQANEDDGVASTSSAPSSTNANMPHPTPPQSNEDDGVASTSSAPSSTNANMPHPTPPQSNEDDGVASTSSAPKFNER